MTIYNGLLACAVIAALLSEGSSGAVTDREVQRRDFDVRLHVASSSPAAELSFQLGVALDTATAHTPLLKSIHTGSRHPDNSSQPLELNGSEKDSYTNWVIFVVVPVVAGVFFIWAGAALVTSIRVLCCPESSGAAVIAVHHITTFGVFLLCRHCRGECVSGGVVADPEMLAYIPITYD